MSRVAIVTSTRAEYGLLVPLIRRIEEDKEIELDLIVTGTHLSIKHGYTISAIIEDGFHIAHQIDILEDDNTPYGVSLTMANAIRGFAECFRNDRPDILVILGDRTEMLGVASAAMSEQIPIAHIHGGELTEGAVDDCVRHAITKMSILHFTATEEYRHRVIQMGENPGRVFNLGALGVENILNLELMSKIEIRADIGIPDDMPYVVITYHPETAGAEVSLEDQIGALCEVMRERRELFFVVTGANADTGGDRINKVLTEFCEDYTNAIFIQSLGTSRYLSAIRYSAFVMGNSSSGILEAPVLGTPTVNIGDRQKGRLRPETVMDCRCSKDDILSAIERAMACERRKTNFYGNGDTSRRILLIMKEMMSKNIIHSNKGFYDIRWNSENV